MNIISMLPDEYLRRMRLRLGVDFEDFLATYTLDPFKGLRFNSSKIRPETRSKLIEEWGLLEVPWCENGYYYSGGLRPGLSPYFAAGLFYIQEPSAMLTAEIADIRPGHAVLDLCAAPGGKSTRLAELSSVLAANEPDPDRARTLSSNIERLGFTNTVVMNAYPDQLEGIFAESFDRVLVDAPCSGEGIFRKNPAAIAEWSPSVVSKCAERQRYILMSAASMVKPGGKLIYSTCTFEEAENEARIKSFVRDHSEFTVGSVCALWPHKSRGEGHFAAVLLKNGDSGANKSRSFDDVRKLAAAARDHGVHVLREGLTKGKFIGGKFGRGYYIPSHAEAMAKSFDKDEGGKLNILSEDICRRFLRGESLRIDEFSRDEAECSADRGWVTVYFDRYPIGNGKLTEGVIKNHYPKGLRLF